MTLFEDDLIERQLIKTFAPADLPTVEELQGLMRRLKQERKPSTFGDSTRQLTRYFHNHQGLGDGFASLVEAKTAAAPQPPGAPYPENLYSCREDLLEQSRLPELHRELGCL